MDVDVIYFSWTGNTKRVAEIIFKELLKLGVRSHLAEIKPKRDYSYIIWLLLSFIPNVGVKIFEVKSTANNIVLCMPKWTLNCPPVTAFLKKAEIQNKMIYLVITYGGFDEKRYAVSYKKKIEKFGGIVKDVLLIRRREIETNKEKIESWVKNNFSIQR